MKMIEISFEGSKASVSCDGVIVNEGQRPQDQSFARNVLSSPALSRYAMVFNQTGKREVTTFMKED